MHLFVCLNAVSEFIRLCETRKLKKKHLKRVFIEEKMYINVFTTMLIRHREGRGHADDAVSLLMTVVRGRRRPLSWPNYRRQSGNYRRLRSSALYASSAFFIMTPS